MNSLNKYIDSQINYNSNKNLFFENVHELFAFSEDTLTQLKRLHNLDGDEIESLVNYTAEKAISEFCRINQYYYFNEDSRCELKNIYRELFASLTQGMATVEQISLNHYEKLRSWLERSNISASKIYTGKGCFLEPVACSEYTPEHQIEVLHIDISRIYEPILDIGCGENGLLIEFLQDKGYEVYGIDRFANERLNIHKADWLEYDYGVEKWGTIISNLGFSNHFYHNHLNEYGDYISYAKKYMEILNSLKKEGSFHYAPSLEFIEQFLDKGRFEIYRSETGIYEFKSTIIKRIY